MYYAYIIENTLNHTYYVGITKSPHERWLRHKSCARNQDKRNTYLYNAINFYGEDSFTFEVIKQFDTRSDCEQFEIDTIQWMEDNYVPNYNLHKGGNIGFNMQEHENYDEWKQKLSDNSVGNAKGTKAHYEWVRKLKLARAGRKPALGMSHTEENKKLFKKVSNDYWNSQDTYVKDAKEILKLSHKEAKQKFGISTTHYYRLKQRFTTNDSK